MDKSRILRLLLLLALLAGALLLNIPSLAAPSVDEYQLGWVTMGGGGGWMSSQDGTYYASATMGQPDAGEEAMSSGEYDLTGGFWALVDGTKVYLPVIQH